MDARAVELINLDLDGRLDAAGRAELDTLLANDSAVRARHQQLRLVARALASAAAPDLPLDFRDSVLRQAQLRQRSNGPAGLRRHWRGGLALAASVLAAVVVLRVAQQPVATDQVTGTLAPATPTVTAAPAADGLALTFDIPAGPPGDLVIEFAGGRRIVVADVGPGRRTVQVTGAGDFSATLVRAGVVTPVARRSP